MTMLSPTGRLDVPRRLVERVDRPDSAPTTSIDERVHLGELNQLLRERWWPDDHWRVSGRVEAGDLDAYGYGILTAPTVGAALGFAATHGPFLLAGAEYGFDRQPDRGVFWFRLPTAVSSFFGPSAELVLGVVLSLVQRAVGVRPVPLEVTCQHDQRASNRVLRQSVGAPVRYAMVRSSIVLNAVDLRSPSLRPDPILADILARRTAALRAAATPKDFVERIRSLARGILARDGNVRLAVLARELGVSPRTLQRRLAAASTSFREVAAEVRRDEAFQLLADRSMSLTEIALQLGFSSLEAFRSAMTRWTGHPPSALRGDEV